MLVGTIWLMMTSLTSCQCVFTEFASETQMMPGSLKGVKQYHAALHPLSPLGPLPVLGIEV